VTDCRYLTIYLILFINARASCAGSLEFKSQTGQILHSVVNGFATASTSTQSS